MNRTKLDPNTANKLVELGAAHDTNPDNLRTALEALRGDPFLISRNPDTSFDALVKMDWSKAFNVIKGLVYAENHGITNYRGSVSLVKYAFQVVDRRDRVLAMEIAAWIVDHSPNDYIPFDMRKIRYAFEEIRHNAKSWEVCREELDRWLSQEWQRQINAADAVAKQQEMADERNRILKDVKARCHAERQQLSATRAKVRDQFLRDLAQLDVKSRLEHLAWDDTRDLSFYPGNFGEVEAEVVFALDGETRTRLISKLQNRPSGPWRKLLKRIEASFSESDGPSLTVETSPK
jgi:hypothetical protein